MPKLYTKVACTNCQIIKEFLTSLNIEFEEIDSTDKTISEAHAALNKKEPDIFTYPVLEVGGNFLFGRQIIDYYMANNSSSS